VRMDFRLIDGPCPCKHDSTSWTTFATYHARSPVHPTSANHGQTGTSPQKRLDEHWQNRHPLPPYIFWRTIQTGPTVLGEQAKHRRLHELPAYWTPPAWDG